MHATGKCHRAREDMGVRQWQNVGGLKSTFGGFCGMCETVVKEGKVRLRSLKEFGVHLIT